MNLTTTALLDLSHSLAGNYLSGFQYPWQALPQIGSFILELGARLQTPFCDSLYHYWGNTLFHTVLSGGENTILNLASNEYARALRPYVGPGVRFIDVIFGELDGERLVEKGVYVKMARGEMVRYLAEHNAQAPEDAGEDVVEPAARDAQEDDLHIADAHVVGLLRGAQHSEHGGGHRCPKDHHEEGGDEGEHHAGAHGVAELLLLLRAEVLGHHDARPGGDAHEEDNQQVQRGPAPAHGGQGVVPHVLADDDGVGGVVELLGNVADEQGHGKGHDLLPGFAHGHVLGFKQFGKF